MCLQQKCIVCVHSIMCVPTNIVSKTTNHISGRAPNQWCLMFSESEAIHFERKQEYILGLVPQTRFLSGRLTVVFQMVGIMISVYF